MRLLSGLVWGVGLTGLWAAPQQSPPAQQTEVEELKKEVAHLKERMVELEQLVRRLAGQGAVEGSAAAPLAARPREAPADGEGSGALRQQPELRAYWREGVHLDSSDGRFRLRLGGRIQNDWSWSWAERGLQAQVGPLPDGTQFRRARLYVSGELQGVQFKAEYDFAGGRPAFNDVYLGLPPLPLVGALRVGHFKEPFSLEELTSSRFTTFLERALPNLFAPSRNTGVALQQEGVQGRVGWSVGVFRQADSFGNSSDGEPSVTARFHALPLFSEQGSRLLHLGLAYSHRSLPGSLRLRQRPEVHLSPFLLDTGSFPADSLNLLGLEAALVRGPFSLQGEYMRAFLNSPLGKARPDGFYVQGSYFLTGEARAYQVGEGTFGRIHPSGSFPVEKAPIAGAWEVALRYSRLDLEDRFLKGGILDNFTLGLNWYWNPYTRLAWNYVFSQKEEVGHANALQTRLQIDF